DPFGRAIHALIAAGFALCLATPNSVVEIAAGPLFAVALIRTPRHIGTWRSLLGRGVGLLVLAWFAWAALALLWSGDRGLGLSELGQFRWVLVMLALWPVIETRAMLVRVFAIGAALGVGVQVADLVGRSIPAFDFLAWDRKPGRVSGWWDPVVGGSLLVAVLGLHLPAAITGRGWVRGIGIAGAAWTALGIALTGTRGAWLAAIGLVALALLWAAWIAGRRALVPIMIAAVLAIIVAAAASLTIGSQLGARAEAAQSEISRAIEERDFNSDTGARLLMAWKAGEAFADHPLHGVGTGGYMAWAYEDLERQDIVTRAQIDDGSALGVRYIHPHAHNALLHVAATQGLIGLLLAGSVMGVAMRSSTRHVPGDGLPGERDGVTFALLGLLLVSAFDAVHINAQTGAVLALLLVCRSPHRPAGGPAA
ncbi:MAG: O-antigen ligase family protein, partial [Planctomycetota bacterium]